MRKQWFEYFGNLFGLIILAIVLHMLAIGNRGIIEAITAFPPLFIGIFGCITTTKMLFVDRNFNHSLNKKFQSETIYKLTKTANFQHMVMWCLIFGIYLHGILICFPYIEMLIVRDVDTVSSIIRWGGLNSIVLMTSIIAYCYYKYKLNIARKELLLFLNI